MAGSETSVCGTKLDHAVVFYQEVNKDQFCAILMNGLPQVVLLILLDIRELMTIRKLYRLLSHN